MMNWIHRYQLFLFDFDGLLVNTEELHYQAYQKMCEKRGYKLPWSFSRYSLAAHYHSTGLRDQVYAEFPELHAKEPDWSVLYAEKKQALIDLLEEGNAALMPGVAELLMALQKANIKRCVVTHSPIPLITLIREQNPLLNTIPHWITREDYTHPKPDPECYQTAIKRLAEPRDRVIGFEDSPRGLTALLGTDAQAVLVCPFEYPNLSEDVKGRFKYYSSLTDINDQNAP
jgi:beta-phosphoglucomutase